MKIGYPKKAGTVACIIRLAQDQIVEYYLLTAL
jgi:hypothetical protein